LFGTSQLDDEQVEASSKDITGFIGQLNGRHQSTSAYLLNIRITNMTTLI